MDNEVVQTENKRKFERLTRKPTEEFEQGIMQSSNGGTAMAAGGPASEDSHMKVAASRGKCNDTINDEFKDSVGGD